jgi:hypothetical protein
MIVDYRSRMTIHEASEHPWLCDDFTLKDERYQQAIPNQRYHRLRDHVRQKYDAWPPPMPPLGRIANYSSLRKHRPLEYHLHDAWFDRRDAQPRFIIKPYSTSCLEGQSANFYCRIIAASPPIVTWHHESKELKQSVKYMKKYADNDYGLTINRVRLDDRGEYIVRAKNSYGSREEVVFLNVQKVRVPSPTRVDEPPRKVVPLKDVQMFEEPEMAPKFSFHLRPRLIQTNHHCKLICSVQGNPPPKIEWCKEGRPVNEDRVQISYRHGVCTLEIFNTSIDDAGEYSCTATNRLGEDSTVCLLTVQGRTGEQQPARSSVVSSYTRTRRVYDSLRVATTEVERSRSAADVPSRRAGPSLTESTPPPPLVVHRPKDDMDANHVIAEMSSPPTFSQPLSDVLIDSGQPVEFACQVNGVPEPFIEWLHNGERLSVSDRVSSSFVGGRAKLRINDVRMEEAGEYSCRASNSAGSETCKATLCLRSVVMNASDAEGNGLAPASASASLAEPTSDVLTLQRHASSSVVDVGSSVTFEASIQGNPADTLWLKNGKEVRSGDGIVIDTVGSTHRLTVEKATVDDAGTYQFEARQGSSTVVTVATLVVNDPNNRVEPFVVKLPQALSVGVGSPAKFVLELENTDNLTVQWFKGTEKIDKSDRIKSVKSGNAFKLDFKTVESEDAGVYVVKVVKDKKAIAKYAASLNVE